MENKYMGTNSVIYGCTDWDAVEIRNSGAAQKGENNWMRLESGNNVIRCVTKPHQYLVHAFKEEGEVGYGVKIYCSSAHKSCPLCEEGNRPKQRWLVGVIDRKTQSPKILDISVSVFKTVQELSRDDSYGNPEKYDINIKVDKHGGATGYYTVMPKPPTPMSANDLEIKSSFNTDDLLKKCTPPTPERVAEKLKFERAKQNGGSPVAKAAKTSQKAKPAQTPVAEMHDSSSDDEYVFQPVDD
jgi:hypothetical protein